MPEYRRALVPGGVYFFTVVTHRRQPLFSTLRNVNLLRTALRRVMSRHPFRIDAMVVLPDHLHAIWTLPADDWAFDRRWRLIKGAVTRGVSAGPASDNTSRKRRGERAVWQRRFWEHLIRDQADFNRHMDYIHYNPVHHGLVDNPGAWPYSSFHRLVERGIYPPGWGASEPESVAGMSFE